MRTSLFIYLIFFLGVEALFGGSISGRVIDGKNGEEIPGATVAVAGTHKGTAANIDGEFYIGGLEPGVYALYCSFISYEPTEIPDVVVGEEDEVVVEIELYGTTYTIDEVSVVAQSSDNSDLAYLMDRKEALVAVQTIGTGELSRKGIGDALNAVANVPGVSLQEGSRNVFVRGLGDRYNATTLNGFPLPSEDPEHKNIALGFFSSDMIGSIDVSKVFNATNSGDVGGAHININTKKLNGNRELAFGISGGVNIMSVGEKILKPEGVNSFGISEDDHPDAYSFDYSNGLEPLNAGIPLNRSLNASYGKRFQTGAGIAPIDFYAVGTHSSDLSYYEERVRSITTGNEDPYQDQLGRKHGVRTNNLLLAGIDHNLGGKHSLAYSLLALHVTNSSFGSYEGRHSDRYQDSESYEGYYLRQQINENLLLSNQLLTEWKLSERTNLNVGMAWNKVRGKEPDRRENSLSRQPDDLYNFTGSNRQKRFFSELNSEDLNAKASLNFSPANNEDWSSTLVVGYTGRFQSDSFVSKEYNYDPYPGLFRLEYLNLDKLYNKENYLRGDFSLQEGVPNTYDVSKYLNSFYTELNLRPSHHLNLSAGLRADMTGIEVDYEVDHTAPGSVRLNKFYLLPSLNIRFDPDQNQSLRFGASRTYTLPQSKEISPYRYVNTGFASQGNVDLQPSVTYNADITWDYFPSATEIISLSAFYKDVSDPIARVEAGNSAGVLKYDNIADHANVAGIELEVRKNLFSHYMEGSSLQRLTLGLNSSYLYSRLLIDMVGTPAREAQLEGAAPFIANAELSYKIVNDDYTFLVSVIARHISDRVHTIGMLGFRDIVEQASTALDFTASYKLSTGFGVKLKASNLLNPSYVLSRERSSGEGTVILNEFKKGVDISLGLSYEF